MNKNVLVEDYGDYTKVHNIPGFPDQTNPEYVRENNRSYHQQEAKKIVKCVEKNQSHEEAEMLDKALNTPDILWGSEENLLFNYNLLKKYIINNSKQGKTLSQSGILNLIKSFENISSIKCFCVDLYDEFDTRGYTVDIEHKNLVLKVKNLTNALYNLTTTGKPLNMPSYASEKKAYAEMLLSDKYKYLENLYHNIKEQNITINSAETDNIIKFASEKLNKSKVSVAEWATGIALIGSLVSIISSNLGGLALTISILATVGATIIPVGFLFDSNVIYNTEMPKNIANYQDITEVIQPKQPIINKNNVKIEKQEYKNKKANKAREQEQEKK